MFKKLSHILTAFLFINCSHPVFFILFNVNDVTQKFIFHFADFIFQNTVIFFSVVILMDPIVLI